MHTTRVGRWWWSGWLGWMVCAGALDAGVVLQVAPGGRDDNPGTIERPFGSLERARDAIRERRRTGGLPAGGVQVHIAGGDYAVRETFRLAAEDSGTAESPVVYQAARGATPRFRGGVRLRQFERVTEASVLERLPAEVRGQVLECDLAAAGVTPLIPLVLGGFSSGRGFRTHPAMELFVDGRPMTWARWPNEGFVKTDGVRGPLTLKAWDSRMGTPEGRIVYAGDRPRRWVGEPDGWLYGYWFWDWADSYEQIESIAVETREITLARPWHSYGYRAQQRYFALHLLSELDAPGEWYLDRRRSRVYLLPPRDLAGAVVELSVIGTPLVELDGVSHVRFEGLLWELGGADGVVIRDGEGCALVGCTVRKLAGNGVEIRGGKGHALRSCNLHTLGRGGAVVAGGDRKTLAAGGHVVENCHLHHLSRIDHTYTPGVWLDGVGHQVRHNQIHDVASSGLRVEGNDHLIELNEVHRVVLESDDQGGADMFGNATYRGNVYRYNYWHHMGHWERRGEEARTGQAGIRLDDAISGVLVQGNVFQRCSGGAVGFGGVQIHGGKDNVIEVNLFVDCGSAISFSPWGEARWRAFVAQALEAPAIDRGLYLGRYPALHRLAEDADKNSIRGNVAVRCGRLLLRAPKGLEVADNVEVAESKDFAEGADGRLVWDPAAAQRLGLEAIPFREIGLQATAQRQSAATGWRLGSDPAPGE